jgi:hypothetical protein
MVLAVGERVSHGEWSDEPQRDIGHPMEKHRFLVDCPASIAREVVRIVPGCEFAEPAPCLGAAEDTGRPSGPNEKQDAKD